MFSSSSVDRFISQTKTLTGLTLLAFKLELLLLVLNDDVAEFPFESSLGMKLFISDFCDVLLTIDGFTS